MHTLIQAEMTLVQTQNLAISIIKFLTESAQVDGILLSLLNCINKPLWENLASDESKLKKFCLLFCLSMYAGSVSAQSGLAPA